MYEMERSPRALRRAAGRIEPSTVTSLLDQLTRITPIIIPAVSLASDTLTASYTRDST
jgi:hypothetical protein